MSENHILFYSLNVDTTYLGKKACVHYSSENKKHYVVNIIFEVVHTSYLRSLFYTENIEKLAMRPVTVYM